MPDSYRAPNVTESVYQPPPTISAQVDIGELLRMYAEMAYRDSGLNNQLAYPPWEDYSYMPQPLPNGSPNPAGPSGQFGMLGDPRMFYQSLRSILQPYMNMPHPGTR